MSEVNKVTFDLSDAYAAAMVGEDVKADGTAEYKAPFKLPGSVSIAFTPQGGQSVFYADGIPYWVGNSNSGYNGDYELADLPEQFYTDILKYYKDGSGALIEDADAPSVHFALLFQFKGDKKKRRHCFYNCVATRPSVESKTVEGDNKNPNTNKVTVTAATIVDSANGNKNIVKATCEEGDAAYADWFTAVHIPTAANATAGH